MVFEVGIVNFPLKDILVVFHLDHELFLAYYLNYQILEVIKLVFFYIAKVGKYLDHDQKKINLYKDLTPVDENLLDLPVLLAVQILGHLVQDLGLPALLAQNPDLLDQSLDLLAHILDLPVDQNLDLLVDQNLVLLDHLDQNLDLVQNLVHHIHELQILVLLGLLDLLDFLDHLDYQNYFLIVKLIAFPYQQKLIVKLYEHFNFDNLL